MIEDPDLRDVSDVSTGDFIGFELFDGAQWRPFGVSRAALRILGGPSAASDIEAFEHNFVRIKGVAFGIGNIGNGRVILNSENFN